ncbi:MAG: hypothetical protein ACRELF_15030 [Gemmataceae bacterium]
MSAMTAAERQELGKLVRLNAKVAKADLDGRAKWLLADIETKLAARYKFEDAVWADITAAAKKAVKDADAQIAALCRERGVPEQFRPSIDLCWFSRGENAVNSRRVEIRRVAQTTIAALLKEAQVEVDRHAAEQLTTIARDGLTSEAARDFIGAMPNPAELMPPLISLQLNDGEFVPLERDVTAVTPVTADGGVVTVSRYRCANCGEPFTPRRTDGKYCGVACRVAHHRRQQQTPPLDHADASHADAASPPAKRKRKGK